MDRRDSITGRPSGDLNITAAVKPAAEPSLDAAYGLSVEQADFFKAETGIDDDDDLKTHILEVQRKAYEVCNVLSFSCTSD